MGGPPRPQATGHSWRPLLAALVALLAGLLLLCWVLRPVVGQARTTQDAAFGPAAVHWTPGRVRFAGAIAAPALWRLPVALVLAALSDLDGHAVLSLDSGGGNLDVALRLGRMMRGLGDWLTLDSEVGAGATCQSACTVLFAAGRERLAASDASFMFHASRFEGRMADPDRAARQRAGIEHDYLAALGTTDPELVRLLMRQGILDGRAPRFVSGGALKGAGLSYVTRLQPTLP